MSLIAPGAPIAERLTLIDCFGSQLARGLAETPVVQEALASSGRSPQVLDAGAGGLQQAFYDILKIPIGEIFKAACFSFIVDLPEYASSRQSEASSMLALPSIAVDSMHYPTIAVEGAGDPFSLSFILDLNLEAEGAQLFVEDRQITGARTGTTLGKMKISMGDRNSLDLKTVEFSLPSQLQFSRPIMIGV